MPEHYFTWQEHTATLPQDGRPVGVEKLGYESMGLSRASRRRRLTFCSEVQPMVMMSELLLLCEPARHPPCWAIVGCRVISEVAWVTAISIHDIDFIIAITV